MPRRGRFQRFKLYLLPFCVPVFLIAISFYRAGFVEHVQHSQELRERSKLAKAKLDELQAIDVASGYDERNYQIEAEEFAELTGLNFENAVSKGEMSSRVARLVDAIVFELRRYQDSVTGERFLSYVAIEPGERTVIEPFVVVEFNLKLKGRFFALETFLDSLSKIASEQKCAVSIGGLKTSVVEPQSNTGVLDITIPLRVYFYEK